MTQTLFDDSIKVFTTCPPSTAVKQEYLRRVEEIAVWSDRAGCEGILVYTDNSLVDPWLVSEGIIRSTEKLCPLVAVQPVYMHPYWVAKMVTSFGNLFGRRMYLNMVAGGFKHDLIALNDDTPHDKRYERLAEYSEVFLDLLRGEAPTTYDGEFYRVSNLKLAPPLDASLYPGMMVSGSSEAGQAVARRIGATAVQYPKPAGEYGSADSGDQLERGIRIGIIAREESDEAWRIARGRFPEDRKGQIKHDLAMKVSDSAWHKQLSDLADGDGREADPYWMVPFQNYKTFCPYLVGSYDRVAIEVKAYISAGYKTIILDVPGSWEQLEHIGRVFELARG